MKQQEPGDHGHPQRPSSDLAESERFRPKESRRDFLGLAAMGSAAATFLVATIGALRLPMPAVFPESNSKKKIGPPDKFQRGSATQLPEVNAWVFRDDDGGMYAISAVCTHLGCIAKREDRGSFICPCHGSKFTSEGKVVAGPAPSALQWLAMSVAPDGQVVIDQTQQVKPGTRLMV